MRKGMVLLGCFIWLSACISFTPTSITTTLPRDIAERNHYIPTAEWKYELGELAGSILIERKIAEDGKRYFLGDRIIMSGTEPEVKPIGDGQHFRIFIDNSADLNLQLLALGGVNLDVNKKMEFTYTDSLRVFIGKADWDTKALAAEAEKPLKQNEKTKYWIQGALLSILQRQEYSEAGSKSSAKIVGSGLQVGTTIYHHSGTITKDYAIHLTLRDLGDFRSDRMVLGEEALVKGLLIHPSSTVID